MNLSKVQIKDISEQIDPSAIKNFIVSDKAVHFPSMSSNFPIIIDGAVFAICISGTGRIKINFKEYETRKGTILTILPNYVLEVVEQSDDMMTEFLIFSPDFLTDMPVSSNFDISMSIIQSPCLQTSEAQADKLLEFHSFIVTQYKRKDHPFREQMAKGLLYTLLIEVGAIYYNKIKESESNPGTDTMSDANSYQKEQVFTFFKLLLHNHKKEKTLQFYANKMCLTPKYLSTIIKERTGRTAFSWINEVLISSTKYMLKIKYTLSS